MNNKTKFKRFLTQSSKKINELSEKNKDKINEEFTYLLSEQTIALYDINSQINTISVFIKKALYKLNSEKITPIVSLKDVHKDLAFKNSLLLTIENVLLNGIEKENEAAKTAIKGLETTSVNLKSMFNPETIAENAVDLNINLMKWRMHPYLDTNITRKKSIF